MRFLRKIFEKTLDFFLIFSLKWILKRFLKEHFWKRKNFFSKCYVEKQEFFEAERNSRFFKLASIFRRRIQHTNKFKISFKFRLFYAKISDYFFCYKIHDSKNRTANGRMTGRENRQSKAAAVFPVRVHSLVIFFFNQLTLCFENIV